jgi:signal transduction histidine kinase
VITRPTILAVDDSADVLAMISGLLNDRYKVKLANSGEKALDLVAATPPDLILLDIMMGGLDGYEVCERLKADPLSRDIPVIFLTAKIESEDEIRGFELGAVDYITKPISPSKLLARVKTHLTLKASADFLKDKNGYLEQRVQERTAELQEINARLIQSQKMECIGQLAGGLAHDFNNLLGVISGYGSLLHDLIDVNDPRSEYVQKVIGAANQGTELIDSLLAFSRTQAMNPQNLNLNKIVCSVASIMERIVGSSIQFTTKTIDTSIPVSVDDGQIQQVLINLCNNARDAMPDGGELTITTDINVIDAKLAATHDVSTLGRHAVITVSDTGKGMDEDTLKKIFEPFFTTKEADKGTGLGLTMVYGIIKQHNGFVDVESEVGNGASFKIYLPVIEPELLA